MTVGHRALCIGSTATPRERRSPRVPGRLTCPRLAGSGARACLPTRVPKPRLHCDRAAHVTTSRVRSPQAATANQRQARLPPGRASRLPPTWSGRPCGPSAAARDAQACDKRPKHAQRRRPAAWVPCSRNRGAAMVASRVARAAARGRARDLPQGAPKRSRCVRPMGTGCDDRRRPPVCVTRARKSCKVLRRGHLGIPSTGPLTVTGVPQFRS